MTLGAAKRRSQSHDRRKRAAGDEPLKRLGARHAERDSGRESAELTAKQAAMALADLFDRPHRRKARLDGDPQQIDAVG